MKTVHKLLFVLLLSSSIAVNAQTDKVMDKASEMEKAWKAYMTPGDAHNMLAKSNGVWSEEIEMWMSPDAPSMKSTSSVSNKMIMGGRYQQGMHKGTFEGMPFEGMSIIGYDNAKNVYLSTWIDNMGTGIMYMEGAWSQEAGGVEFRGKQVDPATGRDLAMREVFKIIDDNNQQLDMYMTTPDGLEYKSMTILMKRQPMTKDGESPAKAADTKKAAPPAKK